MILPTSWSQKKSKSTTASVTASAVPSAPAKPADDLNAYFKPVKWRSIGPFRGGRSVAASGVVGDVTTYYMGTT
ncbi:MAG: hypothetical protein KBD41_11770, partial [Saprospiraceae bacterium]|nr:hypothetical protein [Saprospiraceae bacterium]